jgi:hypothetical protein
LEKTRFTPKDCKAMLFEKPNHTCLRSQLIRATRVGKEIMARNADILDLSHNFSHATKSKPFSTLDVHLEKIYSGQPV